MIKSRDLFLFFIKGVLIGLAIIVPGIDIAALIISLGLYEIIIIATRNLFNDFNTHKTTLLSIVIGIILGVISSSNYFSVLVKNQETIVVFLFVGILFGGSSLVMRKVRNKLSIKDIILFLAIFIGLIIINELSIPILEIDILKINIKSLFLLVLFGLITSTCLILPGISNKLFIIFSGFYEQIINAIKNINNFTNVFIIIVFFISAILGIFFFAKIIYYFMNKDKTNFYVSVLSLVLVSNVIMIGNIKSFSYDFKNILFCIITFLWGYSLARKLDEE